MGDILRIEITEECNGCTLCVLACPVSCLDVDEQAKKVVVVNESACLICRNCEEQCARSCLHVRFRDADRVNSLILRACDFIGTSRQSTKGRQVQLHRGTPRKNIKFTSSEVTPHSSDSSNSLSEACD